MAKLTERLFVGVGGHIAAIDSATGEELWRTKLKTANVATVSIVGDRIYGAASGELFCLDPATGAIMWRNRLKGLGMGVVVFPGMGDAVAASVSEHQRRASAAAV